MPFDRLMLVLSTLAFLAGVVPALRALVSGQWQRGRGAQLVAMLAGFILQTLAVYGRGQVVGQCPMKSLSDILVFIAWSIALLYFLLGSAFRFSLLGMFTAPLLVAMQGLAFMVPNPFPAYPIKGRVDALVEIHVALALIAYAAFALACVTGSMYLLQERLLKRHLIGGLFYQLPPIQGLARAIQRMVLLGVVLLSVSLVVSLFLTNPVGGPKLIVAWGVWGLYTLISLVIWRHALSPRQTARLAALGFILPLLSLWLVT
jgi:HemX protein